MAHDVSVSSFRSDRMSPQALMLAALLHALAALALWAMAQNSSQLPQLEEAIEVTVEQPKPPAPPKEPPPLAPSVRAGLLPPAPLTADRPTQVPPISKVPTPGQPIREQPLLEQAVPPPREPSPPPETAFEFPKPAPLPQVHALSAPPQPPQPRPSPLAPQRPPPTVAHAEEPSPSPFVNPADVLNRARVADNYLWQVAAKLLGYRYKAIAPVGESLTVVRITIARDGRLLAIDVAQSSGFPAIDAGVVAGVRSGSPYAPLPPEIQGASASFTLPLISVNRP